MKRKTALCLLVLLAVSLVLVSCTYSNNNTEVTETNAESTNTEAETDMFLNVKVGSQVFTLTLYDNPSAQALIQRLPLSLDMSEMNGNEKYFFLSDDLPTDSKNVRRIQKGDFMLYGNNCLVLFYKNFSTSYSYTPLGRINNPDGFAEAVGSGDITVEFYQ